MTASTGSADSGFMSGGRHPELRGRVAVVTGGARGIGRGVAHRLAVEGMRLVVADIDGDRLPGTVEELASVAAEVVPIECDLSIADGVDTLFDTVADRFGSVDLLVNNAADLRRRTALDEHRELLDAQLAINVAGPYLCSQRAGRLMRDGGNGGVIVNISSVGALRAHHRGLPYDVTKGAVNSLTLAMAVDLGPFGIRVNGVGPGLTDTERSVGVDPELRAAQLDRIPLGRAGTAGDIAGAVAFLASDDAAYITGQVLYVDGGITSQLSPSGSPL